MKFLSRWARSIVLSAASGVLAGLAASVFLYLLAGATDIRDQNPVIIWLLPLGGLAIGWVYESYGRDVAGGNNLILEEIHNPKNTLPIYMAPLILIGTVVTHLFGGSAGREGTAVQMGASLSDQLAKHLKVSPEERKMLLLCGAGAGFGAAIGTPLAGAIFGMEVIQIGRLSFLAPAECLIASFVAYLTTIAVHAPHTHYPIFVVPNFDFKILLYVAMAGVAFGLAARFFSLLTHAIEHVHARLFKYPPLKPFVAGLLLVFLYRLEGSYRYVGLGLPIIQDSIRHMSHFADPIWKIFFTALTVGSGFKGGEFIPLVFIGATLGSALAAVLPLSYQLLGSVGFAAVFGAASNTPWACAVMACEIFGWSLAPYAFAGCFVAYYISGHAGIYKTQPITHPKFLR